MRKPEDFHGFIGQRKYIRFLRNQIRGCKAMTEPCPHLLLTGASGMGKSTLAQAVATEYGTPCVILHGTKSAKEVCEELVKRAKYDILFFDEAHNLPTKSQELLYQVIDGAPDMDRTVTDHLQGEGDTKRDANGKLVIPPVTIILATDQAGKLLDALRKRMEHIIPLLPYPDKELKEIASNCASGLGMEISRQALLAVARASQGQPRRARNLLIGIRREFHASKNQQRSERDVHHYLRGAGMDALGLDDRQRSYIAKLRKLGHASLERLASLIGSDPEDTRKYIETGLVHLDFVRVDGKGRRLTLASKKWWRNHITELHAAKEARAKKAKKQEDKNENPQTGASSS
jgi:Holliday junction DNA helicase RuvB